MTAAGDDINGLDNTRSAQSLSEALQERAERILGRLSFATSGCAPHEYFQNLVIDLCRSLAVRYTVVARITSHVPPAMQTLAFACDGQIQQSIECVLEGSPCENVVGRQPCTYLDKAQALFPRSEFIQGHNIRAIIGVPLADDENRQLGVVAVLHDQPLNAEVGLLCQTVLEIAALNSSSKIALAFQDEESAHQRLNCELTELRSSDERLQLMSSRLTHVERLASMGRMLAGLAHELSQPLTAITGFAEAAQYYLQARDQDPQMEQWVGNILEAAQRSHDIIQRFRDFVRRPNDSGRPCRIDEGVRYSAELLAFDMRRAGIQVNLDLQAPNSTITVDVIQWQQVVVNLLRNALDAVRNRNSARKVDVTTRLGAGEVILAVLDNGGGVAPEMTSRLFQPFRTDKPQGLGIGLAVSKSIIEAHDGKIWHETTPDGAAFYVRLSAFTMNHPQ